MINNPKEILYVTMGYFSNSVMWSTKYFRDTLCIPISNIFRIKYLNRSLILIFRPSSFDQNLGGIKNSSDLCNNFLLKGGTPVFGKKYPLDFILFFSDSRTPITPYIIPYTFLMTFFHSSSLVLSNSITYLQCLT